MQMSMQGKTCLVTGATAGIGKETALALARDGARVIIVGRNPAKTAAAADEIRAATGNQQVEHLLADLSVQAEVRRLADEVKARCDRLDVLVNNAGGVFPRRELTRDGLEMTFAVNHLGYFLLTNLLLDLLLRSAPARIVSVSSAAHQTARINFADLMSERKYSPMGAYGQSKLANILFTYELARRLEGTGVTATCLHPGVVATNFGATSPLIGWFYRIGARFMLTAAEGADTVIYLASAPQAEGVTGQYFVKRKPVRSNAASHDRETARRLWQMSEQLTGL
ncbi:MAG: rhlG [Symbiobacteriaceae bacterium]|jgi:NAD(P)-dependent dehydrogenase (short-subunit alcohol dehydrogenase family)|nr:rhlG [Symbiobacteriaceae bacterium]